MTRRDKIPPHILFSGNGFICKHCQTQRAVSPNTTLGNLFAKAADFVNRHKRCQPASKPQPDHATA